MIKIDTILQQYKHSYITDTELAFFLPGTPDSRYSKVKRLLSQGKLQHIRRGLYTITNISGNTILPNLFELAQFIYGPSYISLESALSFHGLIPEAVYTTTSVTSKRAKNFKTPLGSFNFMHVPLAELYLGTEIIELDGYKFFMAKPWKALCDYIYCYKKTWTSLEPIENSLRIDLENLPHINNQEIILLKEYYNSSRINNFFKKTQQELNYEH